jgi:hypothetical protein
MAISRDNLQCRIPRPAKESLTRLSNLTERSQTKLIEIFIRQEEQTWLSRMTDDERARYLAGQLGFAEATEIGRRALSTTESRAA